MHCRWIDGLGLVAIFLAGASPLPADWLSLHDGRVLRGVDFEKAKAAGRYRFTLESGEVVFVDEKEVFHLEKSRSDEKVEFRGRRVALRAKIEMLRKERQERDERVLDDLEVWARGDDGADEARQRVERLTEDERHRFFVRALLEKRPASLRRHAARELVKFAAESDGAARQAKGRRDQTVKALAQAALTAPYRSIRDTSLRSLAAIGDPATPDHFVGALRSRNPSERIHAANALSVFPSRRAIPELIDTLHYSWVGFGRGHIMQVTQRAYIADYELVSGGTGFSIVEVADPVVRTNLSGVALDVDVRRVELIARVRALRRNTGQNFGADVKKWRQWWAANGG